MVPCQRRGWWAELIRKSCPVFYRLPREVFDKIIGSIYNEGFPISMERGKEIRKDFEDEREMFRKNNTEAMEGYEEWDFYGEPGVET